MYVQRGLGFELPPTALASAVIFWKVRGGRGGTNWGDGEEGMSGEGKSERESV